jgi:hypothetical protein
MALGYNTYYAMPHLPDYAAASAHEASVKPIRGDAEGRKPLGRRNQKWRRIKREADGSIIIFDDWRGLPDDNWFIRYTPTNELHIYDVCWWNKATYNEVIQRVTGLNMLTEAGRMWARYDGGTVPVSARVKSRWVNNEYVKEGTDPEPTVFVRNERGNWVCLNPERTVTHQVDRKGAKAVRKRYATGINYIMALASLRRDDIPKHEELVAAFRDTLLKGVRDEEVYYYRTRQIMPPVGHHQFTHAHAAYLAGLLASDDPGDQYKAFLWLMREEYETKTKTLLRLAEAVLTMHHHDEWLKQVEHEPGSKAIDRYKWALPQSQTA